MTPSTSPTASVRDRRGLRRAQSLRLVQVGLGHVGRSVARLVAAHRGQWLDRYGVDVRYAGLFDSQGGATREGGLSGARLSEVLESKVAGSSLARLPKERYAEPLEFVGDLRALDDVVLVDCAAGEGPYDSIEHTLSGGGSAVLANKAPLATEQPLFDRLLERGGERLWYEATVGAGLPVISTLRSLLDSGDGVLEIQACASGTLGYITSELMAGTSFSEAVQQAKRLGYTEPDPRDDLSGLDAARKALILARTCGRRLDLGDVRVQPLMPELDPALSVEGFLAALPVHDGELAEKVRRARDAGNSLKYVATVPAKGDVRVGLEETPASSRIGSLSGPDNIFQFRTREYREHPLTVIGPGAGAAVTAMGVLGDVLHAARSVGR